MSRYVLPMLVAIVVGSVAVSAAETRLTVLELMEEVIVPVSDFLWSAEDTPTDDEWLLLTENAATMIVAGTQLEVAAPPAADARWQEQAREMTEAAVAARNAAKSKDADAYLVAMEALYPPCENCHLAFHPALN